MSGQTQVEDRGNGVNFEWFDGLPAEGEHRPVLETMFAMLAASVHLLSPRALKLSVKFFRQMMLSHVKIPETLKGPWAIGGARFPIGSPDYEAIKLLVKVFFLATLNLWKLISGGGPGAMDAASRGAKEALGETVGCPMHFEGQAQTDAHFQFLFENASPRKVRMTALATTIFGFPGGFGTLDELFEVFVLRQHGNMDPIPIYCIGKNAWLKILSVITRKYLRLRSIAESDLLLFAVVDVRKFKVPPRKQWVSILPWWETLYYRLRQKKIPRIRVIGLIEWLQETVAYHQAIHDHILGPEDELAMQRAVELLRTLVVPPEW